MKILRDVFVLEYVVLVTSHENRSIFVLKIVINIEAIRIDFKIYDIDIVCVLYMRFSHVQKAIIVLCDDFFVTFAIGKLQNIVCCGVHSFVVFSFHASMITQFMKYFLDQSQEF